MELLKDLKDIKFPDKNGVTITFPPNWQHDPKVNYPISELIVMRSAAGWYVGTICKPEPTEPDWIEPYHRETIYMTKEEAIQTLHELINNDIIIGY